MREGSEYGRTSERSCELILPGDVRIVSRVVVCGFQCDMQMLECGLGEERLCYTASCMHGYARGYAL